MNTLPQLRWQRAERELERRQDARELVRCWGRRSADRRASGSYPLTFSLVFFVSFGFFPATPCALPDFFICLRNLLTMRYY